MESTQKKINKVELRNLQIEDYAQLASRLPAYMQIKMCSGHTNKLRN